MKHKYKLLVGIFLFVVVFDQITKFLAVEHLTLAFQRAAADDFWSKLKVFLSVKHLYPVRTEPIQVIDGLWQHVYVENPGAAWGLLSRAPEWFRVPFFHAVSAAAIVFIVVFFVRLKENQVLLATALAFVLGGAVGNFIDRIARSYVIDFIDWHWYDNPRLHWPTFNIADSAIVLGVGLMVGEMLFAKKPDAEKKPAAGEKAA